MFQWSKKVVKSVTFNPEVADESLLSLVESHLEPQPEKTFSDLCKEALWQFLCVPESVKTGSNTAATESVEQKIDELQRQVADLEERFFAKESNRLEAMERHIVQLTQQMAHLAILVTERPIIHHQPPTSPAPTPVASAVPAMEMANNNYIATPPEDVDPVISRLSQFLDDF
ncbi:plasmid segregation centromere-binding protein ParR [Nostoc sp. FACHB-152]|uniref:plasmid segregation centromere-binding protein ParR n=1 Tax=unclassified Nostoc TaxID=2593658 RepID=UPI0016823D00|nr:MULTISPECIES: plasmid segregation centromere-binding protein ParR [unclassified Nostoc]MBD2447719.1 plasmid segregation centromere-binding protein ParR [Nostoc sp. FACHB-152]MBD2467011.1 plasmid segregation centromere-binding protein ParR [Nostoc sp. FACHB-145]